jgi:hypothetical protein
MRTHTNGRITSALLAPFCLFFTRDDDDAAVAITAWATLLIALGLGALCARDWLTALGAVRP